MKIFPLNMNWILQSFLPSPATAVLTDLHVPICISTFEFKKLNVWKHLKHSHLLLNGNRLNALLFRSPAFLSFILWHWSPIITLPSPLDRGYSHIPLWKRTASEPADFLQWPSLSSSANTNLAGCSEHQLSFIFLGYFKTSLQALLNGNKITSTSSMKGGGKPTPTAKKNS